MALARGWKQVGQLGGCLLVIAGLPLAPVLLIWLIVSLTDSNSSRVLGAFLLPLLLLTLVGGTFLYRVAGDSLQNRASEPVRWPSWPMVGWGLVMALVGGEAVRHVELGALLFPPFFVVAAALPPLAAVAWTCQQLKETLNRRQFFVALFLGATVSVLLALGLELIAPIVILNAAGGWFRLLREAARLALTGPLGEDVARSLTSEWFMLLLVDLAVIAPLAEEIAKPLPILPLLRAAPSGRRAFLLGATAGAGFAALENLLYTGFGFDAWGGVALGRALGAAVHPLAAGLVALGWYEAAHAPAGGRLRRWLTRFGPAVALHAVWNGGQAVMLALVQADFFGPAPAEVELMGLTVAAVLLPLLALMGAAAWYALHQAGPWILGEARVTVEVSRAVHEPPLPAAVSDRAIAIWAVVCLLIALPVGLAALALLGRF